MSKYKWDIFRVGAWVAVVSPFLGLSIAAVLWCNRLNDLPDQVKDLNHKVDKIMRYLNISNGTNHPDLFAKKQ